MGLLYIMPKSEKEEGQVKISEDSIEVESYGLPLIFWGYFLVSIIIVSGMLLVGHEVIRKMLISDNGLDKFLGVISLFTVLSIPSFGLGLLFYSKKIKRIKEQIIVTHSLFGIPVYKKEFARGELRVEHFLSSPNVAKRGQNFDLKRYENRGHFLLILRTDKGDVTLDRHTNKADLIGLMELLS